MKPRQNEKTIIKQILRYLQNLPGCYAYKRYGGRHNPSEPDISGCIQGIRFEIEVKAPGNKPTPGQRAALKRWRRAGAIVGVAYSVEDARELIEEVHHG